MNKMSFLTALAVCAMAALASAAPPPPPGLRSPCPELFGYERHEAPSEQDPGRWVGRLVVRSTEDLRGVWIRLVFDGALQGVTTDGFESVLSEDKKEVLIKNRDEILLANSPRTLKLNVVYEHLANGKIPNLVEYRLNARTVCPDPNSKRSDYFHGDSSPDFFPYLQSHYRPLPAQPPFKCGLAPVAPNQPHPWAASVYLHHENKDRYACAAALISPAHVITAAHCVTFRNDSDSVPSSMVSVYLGKGDSRIVEVAEIALSPGYQSGYLSNDLAILRLSEPVALGDSISPICISEMKQPEAERGVLVGYEVGQDGGLGEEVLEASALRIDETECVARNPQLRGILDEGTFCLSYGSGNIPCIGNSGSSYFSIHGNRAILRGLVTLGVRLQNSNNCDQKSVVVVADIQRYLIWIGRVIY